MIKEIGTFEFNPEQRKRFATGTLRQNWLQQYPEIFDDSDAEIAKNQPNYHFFEWLAAIVLYTSMGYLSLIEQYEFKRHKRKHALFTKLISPKLLCHIDNQRRAQKIQCPDLLVYAPDMSEWFFCEVKGPRDRMQPQQKSYFEGLARLSGRSVRLIKFREVDKLT